jgi:hypothetical protein
VPFLAAPHPAQRRIGKVAMKNQPKNLPPLEVGQPYVAADFVRFDYSGATLTGSKAILRLHMANGTTIDLPVSDDELRHLLAMLCEAFPADSIALFRQRGWLK